MNIQDQHNFFMKFAYMCASLSKAKDKKVGAVAIKNNLIAFSWNGTVPGTCNETECDGKTLAEVLHAETQAMAKFNRAGVSLKGAAIYCTLSPCIECAKAIWQQGIELVVFHEPYKDLSGLAFLHKHNIPILQLQGDYVIH